MTTTDTDQDDQLKTLMANQRQASQGTDDRLRPMTSIGFVGNNGDGHRSVISEVTTPYNTIRGPIYPAAALVEIEESPHSLQIQPAPPLPPPRDADKPNTTNAKDVAEGDIDQDNLLKAQLANQRQASSGTGAGQPKIGRRETRTTSPTEDEDDLIKQLAAHQASQRAIPSDDEDRLLEEKLAMMRVARGVVPTGAHQAEDALQRKLATAVDPNNNNAETSPSPPIGSLQAQTSDQLIQDVEQDFESLPQRSPRVPNSSTPGAYPMEGINGSSSNLDLSDSDVPSLSPEPDEVQPVPPGDSVVPPGASVASPRPIASSPRDSDTDGLVEAEEIMDESHTNPDSLAQAQEVDLEANTRKAAVANKRKSRITHLLVYLLGFASGSLVIGLALGLKTSSDNNSSDSPTTLPSAAPSAAPSSILDTLLDDLPNATVTKILEEPLSPQWEAYDWTINHPNITIMPKWRKIQLFALATFYYALEGPNWYKVSSYWLRYDVEECFWFNALYGDFIEWGEDGIGWTTEGVTFSEGNQYLFFRDKQCEDGKLRSIVLSGLKLGDYNPYIPPEVALLTSLTSIKLDANGASYAGPGHFLPTEIGLLPNLTALGMWGNRLDGQIPSQLGLLTKLTYLDFDENRLTGPFPTELCTLPELKEVWLSFNSLSGEIPSQIGLLPKLELLDFGANSFSGTLPPRTGYMESLRWIAVWGSALTGSLPLELTMLSTIEGLVLYDNLLSGSIPSQIGSWNNSIREGEGVEALLLGGNSWTGTIPSEIGLFNKMTQLSLVNSDVTGSIPTEVGELTNLRFLDVSNTQISGPLPSKELSNLAGSFELRGLNISANPHLTGTMPEELCMLNSNSSCIFVRSYSVGFHTRMKVPCHLDFDCSENLNGCGCISNSTATNETMQ